MRSFAESSFFNPAALVLTVSFGVGDVLFLRPAGAELQSHRIIYEFVLPKEKHAFKKVATSC